MGEHQRLSSWRDQGVVSGAARDAAVAIQRFATTPIGGWDWLERAGGPFASRQRRRERLAASLNHLASAISSTLAVHDVLETVVDEAKDLVRTDKAVLCLLSHSPEISLDESSVFVRGRRDEYPEQWWRAQLEEVAKGAAASGVSKLSTTREAHLLAVPVKIKNRPIGVLAAINARSRPFAEDDIALMAILAAFAGTIIENERLHSESLCALLADERSRIAKEMHDGLAQSLFSVSLEIDVLRKRRVHHPEEADDRLSRIQSMVTSSATQLRRYIYDLRPLSLNKLGLAGAIDQRAQEIGQSSGLSTRVYVEGDSRPLPPSAEACVYRVVQEAMANSAKHARAKHLYVIMRFDPTSFDIRVEDDGRGFDVEAARRGSEADDTLGLRSMRDRVESEGGRLVIKSSDQGTSVRVMLPC